GQQDDAKDDTMTVAISSERGILFSHPTFNANTRNVALALAERGLLNAVHTSIETTRLARRLRRFPRMSAQVGRRQSGLSDLGVVHSHPSYEIAMRAIQRSRLPAGMTSRLDVH